jgi:DNA polymerase (family 10)
MLELSSMKANQKVATVFNQVARYLEREHGNPFRINAYRFAARNLYQWPQDISRMMRYGEPLTTIPGIGTDLAEKAEQILKTGRTTFRTSYGQPIPTFILELFEVPGLGFRRIYRLYDELHIATQAQLKAAAVSGKLRTVPGFGPKMEADILRYFREQEHHQQAPQTNRWDQQKQ